MSKGGSRSVGLRSPVFKRFPSGPVGDRGIPGQRKERGGVSIQRQLAAILFADIVGFSGQLSRDEPAGLEWRRRIQRLAKASAVSHSGRLVKNLGDGLLLEFTSAV